MINNINSQIIVPLNAFQEASLKILNKNYKETINAEKNYESYISQIEFTKSKFHSRVKQAEQKLLEFKKNAAANKNITEKDIIINTINISKINNFLIYYKFYIFYFTFINFKSEGYLRNFK